jgi:hypothetical protein
MLPLRAPGLDSRRHAADTPTHATQHAPPPYKCPRPSHWSRAFLPGRAHRVARRMRRERPLPRDRGRGRSAFGHLYVTPTRRSQQARAAWGVLSPLHRQPVQCPHSNPSVHLGNPARRLPRNLSSGPVLPRRRRPRRCTSRRSRKPTVSREPEGSTCRRPHGCRSRGYAARAAMSACDTSHFSSSSRVSITRSLRIRSGCSCSAS